MLDYMWLNGACAVACNAFIFIIFMCGRSVACFGTAICSLCVAKSSYLREYTYVWRPCPIWSASRPLYIKSSYATTIRKRKFQQSLMSEWRRSANDKAHLRTCTFVESATCVLLLTCAPLQAPMQTLKTLSSCRLHIHIYIGTLSEHRVVPVFLFPR